MPFPHYTQLDAMDCGPTSLRIVAQHYGRHYSLQTLRERCHITREGVSLLGISDAAESIGFRTTGVKITWEQLRDAATLPCIVHWNQQHFVVVYRIARHRGKWWIYISDPASGLLKYGEEAFLKAWIQSRELPDAAELSDKAGDVTRSSSLSAGKGIALLLEPTPQFYQEKGDEDKRLKFSGLVQYLRPYRSYLVQLALAMLTASVLSLILPFLTQSVVDKGIGTNNLSFVVMMLVAQVVLTLGQLANNLIRSWLMLHMTTRISISLISDFLAKLMRLPIAFFDSKMVGDIMQRIGDYDRIQSFLTGSLLSMGMAVLTFAIYGAVMGGYDLTILGIFLLGSVLYVGWILLFLRRRRKLDYMRFQEAAANQSNIVQLINGMQEIKLNNCEKQKRWEWERIQARLFQVSIKGLVLGQTQEVGGTFIDQTKNVVISFLAASAVIEGEMTLGMMVALQYIIGQLNAPLSQFIQFVQATQDAKISLERLSEIQEKDDEEPTTEERIREIPDSADLEFRGVTFQYDGPHSAKALDDVSVTIPAHKVTAIVGASGSIGSACARILSREVRHINLVARKTAPLEDLAQELNGHGVATFTVSADVKRSLHCADVVLAVTSAVDCIIDPADLKSGAVVCDVARPRNVSREVAALRNDVLVIEGGVIHVPGNVDFHFNFGFPPQTSYACMAETMILALEGRYENFTLGRSLQPAQVDEISALARKHGFSLAGFRNFEQAVTPETIACIRSNVTSNN